MGLVHRGIIGEGVVSSTGLVVSEKGAGANMSVDIAAGLAWVEGDSDTAAQPIYQCRIGSTINLDVAAADVTNPRIDRVVLEVLDATFTGADRKGRVRVIEGTAASSPSAPSEPTTAITLATIAVAANETAITDAEITDLRQPFSPDVTRTGEIAMFRAAAPWGFLELEGGTALTAKYPRLVAYLGYPTPPSWTLDDVRDRFPVASGSTYIPGNNGGAASVTLTTDQIPSHSHSAYGNRSGSGTVGGGGSKTLLSDDLQVLGTVDTVPYLLNFTGVLPTGGGASHENRPPFVSFRFAMRV
jgi:microcystin-dependent protein